MGLIAASATYVAWGVTAYLAVTLASGGRVTLTGHGDWSRIASAVEALQRVRL